MIKNYVQEQSLISNYLKAVLELKQYGILSNKKDFTSQIGEWLIAEVFSGVIAENAIQKGWDLKIGDQLIQVKTHAKAATNSNRKTYLSYPEVCDIDELILVIFSETYQLKEIYKAPWTEVYKRTKYKDTKPAVYWKDLIDFKLDLTMLPNQNVLNLFK